MEEGEGNATCENGSKGITLNANPDGSGTRGNVIWGNAIGQGPGGQVYLGNVGDGDGVAISGMNTTDNRIGGTDSGALNRINFNDRAAVSVDGGAFNSILSNEMFENLFGIQLSNGGNNDQQPPLLSSVVYSPDVGAGSSLVVTGIASGPPNTRLTLQLFDSYDMYESQQGWNLHKSSPLPLTDGTGHVTFAETVPGAKTSWIITATLTDEGGNTSSSSGWSVGSTTPPSGVGAAQPSSAEAGGTVPFHLVTMVTPGGFPASTGTRVFVDAEGGIAYASIALTVPEPATPPAPTLRTPQPGAQIPQNDAGTGCTFNPTRGFGFKIACDWADVSGTTQHRVQMKHQSASVPLVDTVVGQSAHLTVHCDGFVADPNLTGWSWKVQSFASGSWGAFSEPRPSESLPCRLAGGTPCYASLPGQPESPASVENQLSSAGL